MENIIYISNAGHFRTTEWKMTINLDELARSAGKRGFDGYNGCSYVDMPLPRAKKLLRLIRDYGTEKDFEKCFDAFRTNERLLKYWKEIAGCLKT